MVNLWLPQNDRPQFTGNTIKIPTSTPFLGIYRRPLLIDIIPELSSIIIYVYV